MALAVGDTDGIEGFKVPLKSGCGQGGGGTGDGESPAVCPLEEPAALVGFCAVPDARVAAVAAVRAWGWGADCLHGIGRDLEPEFAPVDDLLKQWVVVGDADLVRVG